MSARPHKVRGGMWRTRTYASWDAAVERIRWISFLPESAWEDVRYVDPDGKEYPMRPLIGAMRTIERIYDVAQSYVQAVKS